MLTTAVSLALLSVAGVWLVYKKLPPKVRRFLEGHPLFTDLSSLILIYITLGGTLTALIAAALAGIMVSMMLEVANHPDDYLFLYALKDSAKETTSGIRGWIKDINESYKQKVKA